MTWIYTSLAVPDKPGIIISKNDSQMLPGIYNDKLRSLH